MKVKWNFLNVYGVAHEENKSELLAELAHFCSTSREPYMVAEDFNIIKFASEKNKDIGLSRFSGLFNSIIESQELIDLHMIGEKHLVQQSNLSHSGETG